MNIQEAIQSGDLKFVQTYIEQGGNPNAEIGFGYKLIHHAIKHNQDDILRLLVMYVNINYTSDLPPLTYAVKIGSFSAIHILISSGANVNIRDLTGKTPLHYAAMFSGGDQEYNNILSYELVKYLVDQPNVIILKDHYGNTPLTLAVSAVRIEVVKLLIPILKNNVFENIQNDLDDLLRLALVAKFNHPIQDVIELMIYLVQSGANPNMSIPYKGNLLRYAIDLGDPNIVEVLLVELGADPKLPGPDGLNAYEYAMKSRIKIGFLIKKHNEGHLTKPVW